MSQPAESFPDVAALLNKRFAVAREPRSAEYKAGVAAALCFRLHGVKITCPYALGTAQADAFLSGTDEGHRAGREYLEAREAARTGLNLP